LDTDLAVGAEQGGDQQGAALQALGVAGGRDRDVNRRAGGGEGRQFGGDHDHRDVLGVEVGLADVDAKAFEHRFQTLAGHRRVAQVVAGAVQPDHDAVAREHVLAYALEFDHVLDPRLGETGPGQGQGEGEDDAADDAVTHDAPVGQDCTARTPARSVPQ
jgi:hypothetical protein